MNGGHCSLTLQVVSTGSGLAPGRQGVSVVEREWEGRGRGHEEGLSLPRGSKSSGSRDLIGSDILAYSAGMSNVGA
jgi:hypothetical protein